MANTILVNGKSVGLIGLEAAILALKQEKDSEEIAPLVAAEKILAVVEKKNYIPDAARQAYREALAKQWLAAIGKGTGDEGGHLLIRILGPGCVSCNRLEEIVRSVLDRKKIPADFEHIHDLDEIWRYGVINTPALVINDVVLCSGKMPTQAQIEAWLTEILS